MRGDPSAEALSYKQVSRSASEPLPLTLGTQGVLLIGVGSGMMSLVDGQDVLWGCLRLASRCPRSLRRMRSLRSASKASSLTSLKSIESSTNTA